MQRWPQPEQSANEHTVRVTRGKNSSRLLSIQIEPPLGEIAARGLCDFLTAEYMYDQSNSETHAFAAAAFIHGESDQATVITALTSEGDDPDTTVDALGHEIVERIDPFGTLNYSYVPEEHREYQA